MTEADLESMTNALRDATMDGDCITSWAAHRSQAKYVLGLLAAKDREIEKLLRQIEALHARIDDLADGMTPELTAALDRLAKLDREATPGPCGYDEMELVIAARDALPLLLDVARAAAKTRRVHESEGGVSLVPFGEPDEYGMYPLRADPPIKHKPDCRACALDAALVKLAEGIHE